MILKSLTDFCSDGGENKYFTVNSFEIWWLKKIKDHEMCLNKQQIRCLSFFNCYFTVDPKIFYHIIGILIEFDPTPFLGNTLLYFYESQWRNELKQNKLIK